MSDFKAKVYQIQFRLGPHTRPHWWSLNSAPSDPLAGFKGPTCKGMEGKGREGGERRGEGRREGEKRRREGLAPAQLYFK